jgi:hypothetical protein
MRQDARLIDLPLGIPGSGRQRYGAAMALNRAGQLSDAALEVYRVASAHDGDDPVAMLAERGMPAPRRPAPDPAQALLDLVDETDRYLARQTGPGVAELRARIAIWRDGAVTPAPAAPPNPVVAEHLEAALAPLMSDAPALAVSIRDASPHLCWISYDLYDEDQIGPGFARNHAYATLIGGGGAIPATDFDFGLLLIAPHVFYRDHRHPAPELYMPLTGPNGWRFAPDTPLTILPAHRPVWNEPMAIHATKVGPVPFLAMFGWTADVDLAAEIVAASDWAALEALRLTGGPSDTE